jgi:hypothetical protein
MADEHLEDHAIGVELQITELVEQRERALVQGDAARVATIEAEIAALQEELVRTSEEIADPHYGRAEIHPRQPRGGAGR